VIAGAGVRDLRAGVLLDAWAPRAAPLETLRTIVSSSSASDAGGSDRERAERLASRVHAAVAAIAAARGGRDVAEARPEDTVARYLLRALFGREPTAEEERIFDAVLVLHADHELNASTFAARIVAATEADMTAAVTAAIGALQGPKHGGANEDVAAMLASLDDAASAREWADAKLARYREMTPEERKRPEARFAGFGHRVYKVDDPRAVVLRELGLAATGNSSARRVAEVAEAVREVVQTGLGLPLNVDYYSAVVYVGLGIDPAVYTSIFAASRVVGWCAHVAEQHADNRLIRPRAEYVGPSARSL
jgi:citrate synthase